jgi:hypothetical protein
MAAIPAAWLGKLDRTVASEIRVQVEKLLAIASRSTLAGPSSM